MKKLLSLAIATALLLTLSMTGMAEVTVLENAGLSIDLPEGFQATDISDSESGIVGISIVNMNNPMIIYGITETQVEGMEDVDLATADDTQKDALMQQLGVAEGVTAEIVTDEDGVTYLEMTDETGAMYMQIFVDSGITTAFTVMKMDGTALTDEEIEVMHTLADSLQVVEGDAAPETEEEPTGEVENPEESPEVEDEAA